MLSLQLATVTTPLCSSHSLAMTSEMAHQEPDTNCCIAFVSYCWIYSILQKPTNHCAVLELTHSIMNKRGMTP